MLNKISANPQRRRFLGFSLGALAMAALSPFISITKTLAATMPDKINKSDAEWQAQLTPAQYNVLRREGTEAPFTSALNKEKRVGIFACVACDLPLFPSKYKFDSGTGWPSFFDMLPGAVETKTDYKLVFPRTEYHCARCGGHHGHIFNDGPQPTGLRYCNNGVALKFIADKA